VDVELNERPEIIMRGSWYNFVTALLSSPCIQEVAQEYLDHVREVAGGLQENAGREWHDMADSLKTALRLPL